MDSKGRFDIISFLQVSNVWSLFFYFLQNTAFSFSELISVGFIIIFFSIFYNCIILDTNQTSSRVTLTSSQNIFYSAKCSMSSIFFIFILLVEVYYMNC